MESAERTLSNLQTDYLDVILLYWPNPNSEGAGTVQGAGVQGAVQGTGTVQGVGCRG